MAALKIYGAPMTRAHRVVWMANELGLDYEVVRTHYRDGGTRTPAFLGINPSGQIPAIDDDGFCLAESLAINLYLAKKHGGEIAPKDAAEDGLASQWTLWAQGSVEGPALTALLHRKLLPADERDAAQADAAAGRLARPMAVLDRRLGDRPYLLGDRFTVADLNAAAVVSWVKLAGIDLSGWPRAADWLARCVSRPACAEANAFDNRG